MGGGGFFSSRPHLVADKLHKLAVRAMLLGIDTPPRPVPPVKDIEAVGNVLRAPLAGEKNAGVIGEELEMVGPERKLLVKAQLARRQIQQENADGSWRSVHACAERIAGTAQKCLIMIDMQRPAGLHLSGKLP